MSKIEAFDSLINGTTMLKSSGYKIFHRGSPYCDMGKQISISIDRNQTNQFSRTIPETWTASKTFGALDKMTSHKVIREGVTSPYHDRFTSTFNGCSCMIRVIKLIFMTPYTRFSHTNQSYRGLVCPKNMSPILFGPMIGPIPKHIGFVMDGNRRFAKKLQVETGEGHYMGFIKLKEILGICMQLGIQAVTVYAFSIENFKRSKAEVKTLMELARARLKDLYENQELIDKYGVSIRILGNTSLLPEDLRSEMEKAVELTKHNTRAIFNLCSPYASSEEMTTAIRKILQRVESGKSAIEDINEKLLADNLYTAGCPPLEVVIRTSGESRLSDFMLWQCHENCRINFVDCHWPEFTLWKMLPIILDYQLGFSQ
ncbi:hypothetical protein G9A89_010651 [Geosiphon pyriformis]|nr:hypothetical protein G9A89_010651 [Geosiphon pyriformis]